MSEDVAKKKSPGWVRGVVDYLAVIAFGLTFAVTRDFQKATAVLVGACVIALVVGWIFERRLAPMPLFMGVMAVVFGGLTLFFKDSSFLKMKLTIVEVILGSVLVGGVLMGKNPLKFIFGDSISLPDKALKVLSLRYAAFFFACAIANEVIWRTQSDGVWVTWRVVLLVLALVFSVFQVPYIMKHMQQPEEAKAPPPPEGGF